MERERKEISQNNQIKELDEEQKEYPTEVEKRTVLLRKKSTMSRIKRFEERKIRKQERMV